APPAPAGRARARRRSCAAWSNLKPSPWAHSYPRRLAGRTSDARQPSNRPPRDLGPVGPIRQLVAELVQGLVELEGPQHGVVGLALGHQLLDPAGAVVALEEG